MNIALIAHSSRRELLVQFCTAYCGILSQHCLCASSETGFAIQSETGLDIETIIADNEGALEQIATRVAYNEIDLVFFFRDVMENSGDTILKLCDKNMIPFATNLATAEVLVQGLARGDLDWRDIVNPKGK
ncbi:MAG: methylglyoxal synthase [Clostridia bacterium]|nr:methylglyoxal synthase [Clostridia bacterium]